MEFNWISFWAGIIVINFVILYTAADTRYECIVNLMSRGEGGGWGDGGGYYGGGFEADEFENEIGEVGEMDEAEDGGGIGAAMRATGSLTCPQGNRGHILVKRVAYGTSLFGTTCRSDGYCKEEYDPADGVAVKCDGKSSCFIDMLQPVYLQCGRMSTYMLVEYECVDSWTTFDVCESISTVARGSSIFLTSPGYLTASNQKVRSGSQMCECILQTQNKADIYMDYLQIQLSSEGNTCPYEYVMVESKKNITASTIDKELEVCGRKHVGSRWFQGSIRLTYAAGGQMQKRGMIAKFTADNIGTAPRIELECGHVDATRLNLKERPASSVNPLPRSPMMPFGPYPGMNFPRPMYPPMYPTMFPGAMNNSLPPSPPIFPSLFPPAPGQPDFSNWKINIPGDNDAPPGGAPKSAPSMGPAPAEQAVPTPPTRKAGGKRNIGRKVVRRPAVGKKNAGIGRKNRAGKVVDGEATGDGDGEKVKTVAQSGNGGMVGLVFGGIGAFLIIGSVGILAIHNYRKRQRIKREEAEYYYGRSASSTYGQGWKKGADQDGESVYATVAEVETYRQSCVNPAVSNVGEASFINPVAKIFGKGKGKGKKSDKSIYHEPEVVRPSTSSCSKEAKSKPETETEGNEKVAVIEVHQEPEKHITVTYGNELHSDACIAANSYSSVKARGENRCSECNIARPPRRRDSDYDNNIGVKKVPK